jgi:hypothetical protein
MSRHYALAMLSMTLTTLLVVPNFASGQDIETIRFELDDHGAVIIPAFVNGLGPLRFLVDTGSSGSAITESLQTRLAAPIVAKTETITAAGRAFLPVARVDRISVGHVTSHALVTILPAGALAAAAVNLDGVLGQDFLGQYSYTIDYGARTLTWNVAAGDGRGMRLPLVSRDGRLLVELAQGRDRVIHLVPDSGTDGLVLFSRAGVMPLALDALPLRTQLTGMVGSESVTPAIVRRLQVGTITLRDQPAVTVARNEADAPAGDGLLPLHHFSSVTFSTAGYIVFRR